jgi:hypothetical protein
MLGQVASNLNTTSLDTGTAASTAADTHDDALRSNNVYDSRLGSFEQDFFAISGFKELRERNEGLTDFVFREKLTDGKGKEGKNGFNSRFSGLLMDGKADVSKIKQKP